MKRIGLLSDTHGFLNPALYSFFENCDEIWHAGDWGSVQLMKDLEAFKPLKGVYGNIDGQEIRISYPETASFVVEGLSVFMIHIGGYPGHYSPQLRKALSGRTENPGLVICGHSHILRVMRDPKNHWLFINPGACGNHGFQKVNTAVRFTIDNGRPGSLEVWEQKRG